MTRDRSGSQPRVHDPSVAAAATAPAPAPDWAVAIVASREDARTLQATLESVLDASDARVTTIDLLVNGNAGLVREVAQHLAGGRLTPGRRERIRLWSIDFGDKANAWNQYVHRVWAGSRLVFFVDGYCRVDRKAFEALANGLERKPECLAATGVPSTGRSAGRLRRQMQSEGGIHGNLHVLRGEVLAKMRSLGFKLPVGLYRTDALVGAALSFNLDPGRFDWDSRRILLVDDARWSLRHLSLWRPADLKAHAMRRLRQEQGRLENLAVRRQLAELRRPVGSLAPTARGLVEEWLAESGYRPGNSLFERWLFRTAHSRLLAWQAPPPERLSARQVETSN